MPPKGAKILVDNCVPFGLVIKLREITTFQYIDAFSENVHAIPDSDLLAFADKIGCSVVLTTDQKIHFRGRRTGLVIIGSNDNDTVVAHAQEIVRAIQSITRPGTVVKVPIVTPRPQSRRRQ